MLIVSFKCMVHKFLDLFPLCLYILHTFVDYIHEGFPVYSSYTVWVQSYSHVLACDVKTAADT